MFKNLRFTILPFLLLLTNGCSEDEGTQMSTINLLSISIDGAIVNGSSNSVDTNPQVTITFDAALSSESFENAFIISGGSETPTFNISYSNANSKAIIDLMLERDETYTLSIGAVDLGAAGQVLSTPLSLIITTEVGQQAACTSATNDCLRQLEFEDGGINYSLDYYSNYSLQSDLNQITNAVILVHGANRNNDDYFKWMTTTFEDIDVSNNTLLIAPKFKSQSETTSGMELYWVDNNWRDGEDSANDFQVSSFTVIDSLINFLSTNISSLNKVIITGHSSGGLFTHVYAAANTVANNLPGTVAMEYIVANSQYFYYPGEERVNEDNNQLFVPTDCSGYRFWPIGPTLLPSYLSGTDEDVINYQLVSRPVHYLLGNGNQSDPSLNTTNCSATLLGSSRYNRGENINYFIETKFPENIHERAIVEGIGHDGEAMYMSDEFKTLLKSLVD